MRERVSGGKKSVLQKYVDKHEKIDKKRMIVLKEFCIFKHLYMLWILNNPPAIFQFIL